MTEPEADLYDELGVTPDASAEALRAGYRRRARQLHPDVAEEATTGDAMRRLNQAWAVLSDPSRRRMYDQSLAGAAGGSSRRLPAAAAAESGKPDGLVEVRARRPFLRPSALILVILAVIFVVTAYAGSWPGDQGVPAGSTPGRAPATTPGRGGSAPVMGQCLVQQPEPAGVAGQVVVVPCSAPNEGQILAEVTSPWDCPAGTYGYPWRQHPTILCATSSHRLSAP